MNLPKQLTVHYQPYGTFILGGLQIVEGQFTHDDFAEITGTVISGTERSRLFGSVSVRDISGERNTVYGVRQWELDAGECTRVAM